MITFSILIHPPLTPIVTEVPGLWCQERAVPPGWPPEILGRVWRKIQNTNFAERRTSPHWKIKFRNQYVLNQLNYLH